MVPRSAGLFAGSGPALSRPAHPLELRRALGPLFRHAPLYHSGSDSAFTFRGPSSIYRWRSRAHTRSLPGATPDLCVTNRLPHVPSAVDSCSPFLFPSLIRLALASAETLRPAPLAVLLLAHPARPSGFGSPGNISTLSHPPLDEILPVPPKKHAHRLGSSSLALRVPKRNGQKRST